MTKTTLLFSVVVLVGCGSSRSGTGGDAALDRGPDSGDPDRPLTDTPADRPVDVAPEVRIDAPMGCMPLGDPCTACEFAECASEYCACYANVSCGRLGTCIEACPDGPSGDACRQTCLSNNPDGISAGGLLVHCAATVCGTGGAGACEGYAPLDPCQLCLFEQCASDMNSCLANADCAAILACVASCTSDPCREACPGMHPGGIFLAASVGSCLDRSCSAQCATGP